MDQSRLDSFEAHRGAGLSLAYRMLGSAADAEDIMQEAWLRWERYEASIEQPRSFMLATVSRLCLDHMGSARARRERYVGEWLPEPVGWAGEGSPEQQVVWRESITLAFLHVLERLEPRERMVFLLRRVFEVEHEQIAAQLDISAAACRQLYSRAAQRFDAARPGAPDAPAAPAAPDAQREALGKMIAAVASQDLDALRAVLHEQVVVYSDGGGKVTAATRPVRGADAASRLLIGSAKRARADLRIDFIEVNGGVAVGMFVGDQIFSVVSAEVVGDQIERLYIVLNPDKLAGLQRQVEVL